MFALSRSEHDAIEMLKKDHEKVKDIFEKFEKSEDRREKVGLAKQAIEELKIHAALEEEIFYATVRPQIENKIMNEADEEHHVAKLLISELERMKGTEDHYDAKVKVLAENIRHHIREEESDMLPKARHLDLDMEMIGQDMAARKVQLKKTGVATFAEEKLMRSSRGDNDSPAQAARTKKRSSSRIKLVKSTRGTSQAKAGTSKKKATAQKATAGKRTAAKRAMPKKASGTQRKGNKAGRTARR